MFTEYHGSDLRTAYLRVSSVYGVFLRLICVQRVLETHLYTVRLGDTQRMIDTTVFERLHILIAFSTKPGWFKFRLEMRASAGEDFYSLVGRA